MPADIRKNCYRQTAYEDFPEAQRLQVPGGHRIHQQEQSHHAEPVDGTQRAVQKSPVDKLAGVHGTVDNLQAPADKRIQYKQSIPL